MKHDPEFIKELRDAIFFAALCRWEESCTFDELSDEGKETYEDYARAAAEVAYRRFGGVSVWTHEDIEKARHEPHA